MGGKQVSFSSLSPPTLTIHAAFQAVRGQLTSRLKMISFLTKQADFKVERYRLLQPLTLSHSQLQLLYNPDNLQIPQRAAEQEVFLLLF